MNVRKALLTVGAAAVVSVGAVAGWALARSDAPSDNSVFEAITSTPSLGTKNPAVMVTGTVYALPIPLEDGVRIADSKAELAELEVHEVVFDRMSVFPRDSAIRESDAAPSRGDTILVAVESGAVPEWLLGEELVAWLGPTFDDSPRWSATIGALSGGDITFFGQDVSYMNAQIEHVSSVFSLSEFEAMERLGLQLLDRHLDESDRAYTTREFVDVVREVRKDGGEDAELAAWLSTDAKQRGLQEDSAPPEIWRDAVTKRALFRIDLTSDTYPTNTVVVIRSASGISSAIAIDVDQPDDLVAGLPGEALQLVLADGSDFDGELLATIAYDTWSRAPSLVIDVTDSGGRLAGSFTVAEDNKYGGLEPRS